LLVTITNLLETGGSMNWFIFDASPNQPDSDLHCEIRGEWTAIRYTTTTTTHTFAVPIDLHTEEIYELECNLDIIDYVTNYN
jgi:hypothetical protein